MPKTKKALQKIEIHTQKLIKRTKSPFRAYRLANMLRISKPLFKTTLNYIRKEYYLFFGTSLAGQKTQ
jgi:hypothetical protein